MSAAFYVTSGCTHLSAASPSLSWFAIFLFERTYFFFFFLYELSGIHFKGLLILMEFTCFGTSLRRGMVLRCFLQFMVYRSYSFICFLCKLAVARYPLSQLAPTPPVKCEDAVNPIFVKADWRARFVLKGVVPSSPRRVSFGNYAKMPLAP